MQYRAFAYACLVGLSACQPVEPLPVAGSKSDAPDPVPATLIGEYRVAGIDGLEVGGGIGIALSITADEIAFDPRCAGFRWSYTYKGGALAAQRPNGPVCKIGVHPEQQRLARALDAVTQARRNPANGIELSGGGHSVTLFSQ